MKVILFGSCIKVNRFRETDIKRPISVKNTNEVVRKNHIIYRNVIFVEVVTVTKLLEMVVVVWDV